METINSGSVLCSEAGGQRSVQSESGGLLGSAGLVLAAGEVLRGKVGRRQDRDIQVLLHTSDHIIDCCEVDI